jgi:hypothetical protein
MALRVERRNAWLADLEPLAFRLDANIDQHDPAHARHGRHLAVRRLQGTERDGEVVGSDRRKGRTVVRRDAAGKVAGDGDQRPVH